MPHRLQTYATSSHHRNVACQASFSSQISASINRSSANCVRSTSIVRRHLANLRTRARPQSLARIRWTSAGSTSHRNRVFDSLNNRDNWPGVAVVPHATASTSNPPPNPPANAISAAATASPPSLKSWHARTSPPLNRPMHRRKCLAAHVPRSTVGTCPPSRPFTSAKCEPPSSSRVSPTRYSKIARLLEIHRHAPRHVVDLPHRADQQRRRNRDRLPLARSRPCS